MFEFGGSTRWAFRLAVRLVQTEPAPQVPDPTGYLDDTTRPAGSPQTSESSHESGWWWRPAGGTGLVGSKVPN